MPEVASNEEVTERTVIVAGVGPVPPHEPEKLHAPGLRLWGFADHLERRGHRVVLCEAMFGGAEARARPELFAGRRIAHEILPLDLDGAAARLRQIAARERAGALVAFTN
jgi:hypothetical protein